MQTPLLHHSVLIYFTYDTAKVYTCILVNQYKFKCQHVYHTHSHNNEVANHVTELCLIPTV
jgi:hypothetical protein